MSGDGTECGCEGEAEGASESTGCGGLEDLQREEGETAISGCRLWPQMLCKPMEESLEPKSLRW